MTYDAYFLHIDGGQHIDRYFMADFIKTLRSETGKSNLFALGEFWKDSFDDLSGYVNALGTQVRRVPSSWLRSPNTPASY